MIFSASSRVMPLTISVRAEAEAMALAQPKVLNLASLIRLFSSSLNVNLRASPQAMDPTSATPSGFSTSPTLRGFRKCSLTLSVYSHIVCTPDLMNRSKITCSHFNSSSTTKDTKITKKILSVLYPLCALRGRRRSFNPTKCLHRFRETRRHCKARPKVFILHDIFACTTKC